MENTVEYRFNKLYNSVEAITDNYIVIRTPDLVMQAFDKKTESILDIFDLRDKMQDMTVREVTTAEREFCKKYGVEMNKIGQTFKENMPF